MCAYAAMTNICTLINGGIFSQILRKNLSKERGEKTVRQNIACIAYFYNIGSWS
jgi:hypothetical protein